MNVYSAAVYSNNYMPGQNRYKKLNDVERNVVEGLPHILESYHYVKKQAYVDAMRNNGAKVFVDSGAFSAHTLGVELRVEDYVEYLRRNLDIIRQEDGLYIASVLDGIGDAYLTYANQKKMEQLGFCALPCFHAGEDERYLQYYVENYEYITLGGMVGSSTKALMVWLDRMWDRYLVDGSGNPRLKVHGFGITSTPIMERYPWHSVDSSSWIQAAAFGSIVDPELGPVSVSDKSPSRKDQGQHVATLTQIEQDYVFQRLEERQFTFERLATVYESRAAYNLWAYTVINKLIDAARTKTTFQCPVQELF